MNPLRLLCSSSQAGALFCLGSVLTFPGCGTEGGNPHKQEDKQTERQNTAESPPSETSMPDANKDPASTASGAAKIVVPQCTFALLFSQNDTGNMTPDRFSFEFLSTDSALKPEFFTAKLANKETPEKLAKVGELTPAPGVWILVVEQTLPSVSPAPSSEPVGSSGVTVYCQAEFTIDPSFTSRQSIKIQVNGRR